MQRPFKKRRFLETFGDKSFIEYSNEINFNEAKILDKIDNLEKINMNLINYIKKTNKEIKNINKKLNIINNNRNLNHEKNDDRNEYEYNNSYFS